MDKHERLGAMPGTVRDQLGDKTLDRLLGATLTCVSQLGIAATSTRQIAKMAQVNQGVLHYHFESKDQLLLTVLKMIYRNSAANIDALANCDMRPKERLEAIIDLGFDLIERRQEEFIALVAYWAHAMTSDETWRKAYRHTFDDFRDAILRIIREGEELGEFPPGTAKVVPFLIVAIVQGIGLQLAIAPDAIDATEARAGAKRALRSLLSNPLGESAKEDRN